MRNGQAYSQTATMPAAVTGLCFVHCEGIASSEKLPGSAEALTEGKWLYSSDLFLLRFFALFLNTNLRRWTGGVLKDLIGIIVSAYSNRSKEGVTLELTLTQNPAPFRNRIPA